MGRYDAIISSLGQGSSSTKKQEKDDDEQNDANTSAAVITDARAHVIASATE